MTRIVVCLTAMCAFLLVNSTTFAEDKPAWHCEKTVDGETKDLKEVKTRRDCKQAGGKWTKAHNHDHDGHHDGDGHDHSKDKKEDE